MATDDHLAQRFGRTFAAGSILFRQGDEGHEMFVIRTGEVTISKTVGDLEKQLGTLGPGEFLGEMSLLNGKPRTATATVLSASELLVIDPKTFGAMVRGSGEIAVRMIKKLADRLAEADTQIENLLLRGAGSRVAHYLSRAAEARGQREGNGWLVPLPIADLPGLLGLRPEQVKEVLQQLTRGGIAHFEIDQVHLLDPRRLQEYGEAQALKERVADGSDPH